MANPDWFDPSDFNDRETCAGCLQQRVIRDVLDGDKLCQSCCDAWARNEGIDAREREQDLAEDVGRVRASLEAGVEPETG